MSETTETTAIEKKEKAEMVMGALGFELRNLDQVYRYGKIVCASGLAPKDETPEGVVIKVEYGRQLGLSNMAALQNIANINGRPSLWGDAALALVRASGLVESFVETFEGSGDELTAICRTKRKGEPDIHERTFSVEDAKIANLWGKVGPWKQYPKRMLQMRARGWAMRDVYPDVLKGISLAEESRDIPRDYIDTTATETPEKPKRGADALAEKLKAKKSATRESINEPTPEPTQTPTEQEKEPTGPEIGASEVDLNELINPTDETGAELDPEGDTMEAGELEAQKRQALVAKINEMRKFKSRTFSGFVNELCHQPTHWDTELNIESLEVLADKLDASK